MYERRYNKRKRKRILFKRVVVAILLLVIIVSAIVFAVNRKSREGINKENEAKIQKIQKNSQKYPKELLELLEHNKETVDFVYDYPRKKKSKPANSIGKVKKGEIPKLLQWDERWGYAKYSDNIIAINGCGPTALAMVAAGLTGDDTITPYKVAKYAAKNGYYVEGTGSSWSLMTEGSEHFGVQGSELVLDQNIIFSELEDGHPIICSMRPGDFTTTGHFIVLARIRNGKIQVNDPNSKKRSKLWDYDRLEHQISNLWVFTAY